MNFVAIHKGSGELMMGAKGQCAFHTKESLGKSIGQSYYARRLAQEAGCSPKDLYHVVELDLEKLARKAMNAEKLEPLKVVETITDGGSYRSDHIQVRAYVGRDYVFDDGCGDFSECPEDANTDRDLAFVGEIADALEKAHQAGLEGREFVYEFKEVKEEE